MNSSNKIRPFAPGAPNPNFRPTELPTFGTGKPVCPSGVKPNQGTSRVQNPDGTWTTVATGAWTCGPVRPIGVMG